MIDSHCHIDLEPFNNDRDNVIKESLSLGVKRIMVPGLYEKQWHKLIGLQSTHSHLDIAFGLHPYYLNDTSPFNIDDKLTALRDMLSCHAQKASAIGETGVDRVIEFSVSKQIQSLEGQVELASTYKLPLILHHRKSHNELIRILKQTNFTEGGFIHAFSGSAQIAKTYVDLGFKLGIGGTITYSRSNKTREAITSVGLDHLVLETDAPDMPLCGFQGQRNSPTQLPLVLSKLAEILKVDTSDVDEQTSKNYFEVLSSTATPSRI